VGRDPQRRHELIFLCHWDVQAEGSWQQQEISIHGKKAMQPRLISYMADSPELHYTYSRTRQTALPWTPTVLLIKASAQTSVLLASPPFRVTSKVGLQP